MTYFASYEILRDINLKKNDSILFLDNHWKYIYLYVLFFKNKQLTMLDFIDIS